MEGFLHDFQKQFRTVSAFDGVFVIIFFKTMYNKTRPTLITVAKFNLELDYLDTTKTCSNNCLFRVYKNERTFDYRFF